MLDARSVATLPVRFDARKIKGFKIMED